MKKLIFLVMVVVGLFLLSPSIAEARVRVRGYYKRNTGTYVIPHYRTNPNRFRYDNWSSKGNYNPFTGRKGYKSWW